MAEIDPSITAGAGQQPNMLGQFGQLAGALVHLQQNRLLGQEAASRERMGQLAQAHTGQDGSFDSNGYVRSILSDPVTAAFAPAVANQFAERGLIDANTTARNIENWKARADIMASAAGAAAGEIPSDSSPADTRGYIKRVSDLLGQKNPDGTTMFTPQQLTSYLTGALTGVKTNADLKQHVLGIAQTALRGREMLENVGTQMGLGPNGEPKLYFYNKLAQGAGAGANAPAAAAYMTGAGGPGPGQGAGGAAGAPAPSGAPSAPGTPPASPGLTLGPSEPEQQQLKDLPAYVRGVNASAANAQNLNFQLDKLEEIRKSMKTGGGAGTYAEFAKLMQAAGLPRDWSDRVANGSLPASQTFQSLSQQVAVNLMKQQLLSHDQDTSGAGRLLQSEWSSYIANKPNWEHDPRTLDSLLGFMRKQNGLAQAKANALQLTLLRLRKGEQVGDMRGQADVLSAFEPYWINNLYSRGIITQGTAEQLAGGAK